MKIFVKAKPNVRKECVERIDSTHFVVAVKEPPIQGRANQAIIKALAGYFGISSSQVRIISGHTSRNKSIEIFTINQT